MVENKSIGIIIYVNTNTIFFKTNGNKILNNKIRIGDVIKYDKWSGFL